MRNTRKRISVPSWVHDLDYRDPLVIQWLEQQTGGRVLESWQGRHQGDITDTWHDHFHQRPDSPTPAALTAIVYTSDNPVGTEFVDGVEPASRDWALVFPAITQHRAAAGHSENLRVVNVYLLAEK